MGGLSWCHWVQQAEPERGPLLAAAARVVPVPQIHTHTGDREEEWHRSDCSTAHSTDTSTSLQAFGPNPCFWIIVSNKSGANYKPKNQCGGKKTWRRSKERVGRLCRSADSFCFGKEWEEKQGFTAAGKTTKLVYFCFFYFLLLHTCRGTANLNKIKLFKREGKEIKWKCWRYAWNWWGVNLKKAFRRPPAVIWKVRINCDDCGVVS